MGWFENRLLFTGTKYKIDKEFLYDIIVYKLKCDNILQEVLRFPNVHDKILIV